MRAVAPRLRHGVEASQPFDAQRRLLLRDLAANANDRSLAGRVDPLIAPLVSFVNDRFEQYVTTSSCSGRFALFHRGKIEDAAAAGPTLNGAPANVEGSVSTSKDRKRGGFGLGTLFQSHDPLPDVDAAIRDGLVPALEQFWRWHRQRSPLSTPRTLRTEVLQLKFEPMIIHILCRDIEAAARLLQCASEAAQGDSGVISCSRGTSDHRKITCCVASPLTFDIPLFSEGRWLLPAQAADGGPAPAFSDPAWVGFLTQAVSRANALFAENAARTERFRQELEKRELPGADKE